MKSEKDFKLDLQYSPLKKYLLLRWKNCCKLNYWPCFFTLLCIHFLSNTNLPFMKSGLYFSILFIKILPNNLLWPIS